jgi:hypothetical protein
LKKNLFIALVILTLASCTSSNHKEHAQFMSVPINGTIHSFIARMSAKGFVNPVTNNDVTIMEGKFINESCRLFIKTTYTSRIVHSVTVVYPSYNNWEDLYSHYCGLRAMYTEKYGEPEITETGEDIEDKLQGLKDFELSYHTVYNTPKGNITIFLDSSDTSVNIHYYDSENSILSQKEREKELNSII